ncbi:MAG: hypothetical protein BWX70_02681 [Verrucomicrobia bacterium ADurb.Bin070]|nr:MAG: hypothetical protein BWX70_02681 [Verrucomicrobia bacterium ADurb.Bin070]
MCEPRSSFVELCDHAGRVLPCLVENEVPDVLRLRVCLVRRLDEKRHVRKVDSLRALRVLRHEREPARNPRAHGKHALQSGLGELLCHLVGMREPRRESGSVVNYPRREDLANGRLAAGRWSGDCHAARSLLAQYAQGLDDPRGQRWVERSRPRRPRSDNDVVARPIGDLAPVLRAEHVGGCGGQCCVGRHG